MVLAWPVIAVIAATVFFTLFVRMKDIPEPEPVSPARHLEERKAAIYENLRDLQFEYRVGKLSDEDYQQSKQGLQKELAGVIAEINKLTAGAASATSAKVSAAAPKTAAPKTDSSKTAKQPAGAVCPHCGAKFQKSMKFCGECGKEM